MGFTAVVLAFVFSAFTTSKPNANSDAQATYKYYAVSYAAPYQANGAILQSTDLPFGSTARTHQYALDNDGCSDSGSKNCVRGFSSGNAPTSFPSQLTGDDQTPKP